MNAHFTSTESATHAKAPVSIADMRVEDPAAIRPNMLVYCQPTAANPTPEHEGVTLVLDVRDGKFGALASPIQEGRSAPLVWENLDTITHYLPGYEVIFGGHVLAGANDANLIALGQGIEASISAYKGAWKAASDIREKLDAVDLKAHENDASYAAALTAFNDIACPMALLSEAAKRCRRAKTPAGHAAKMIACRFNAVDVGFEVSNETITDLADEAVALANYIQPPVTTGTDLAALIEQHRAAEAAYEAASVRQSETSDAWRAECNARIYTTPVRIRDGRVVASHIVDGFGYDDRAIINREHDRWLADLSVNSVTAVSATAGKLLRDQVEASRAECLRIYAEVTMAELKPKMAEVLAADEAYDAAYSADDATITALLRHKPASLDEVAAVVRYLLTTSNYRAGLPEEYHQVWLATLSTLGQVEWRDVDH